MTRFKNDLARRLAEGERPRELPASLHDRARKRLDRVLSATELYDLRNPPSNRLEALVGDRQGTFSIRINIRWRICFVWTDLGAAEIEVVDYHR